jgi:hypothetical protein
VDAAAAAEGHYSLQQQQQNHNGLDDHHHYDAAGGYYYAAAEDAFHNGGGAGGGLPPRAAARRANGVTTRRACHYFIKGVCKNGQNCPFSHHHAYSDGFADDSHHNGGGGGGTPGALEKLEMEITELLNSRHGQPLSIASLPTLYGERYGKGLQAEGYLTESQRHGKAGYSLTKLLSRLNKIRVIERYVTTRLYNHNLTKKIDVIIQVYQAPNHWTMHTSGRMGSTRWFSLRTPPGTRNSGAREEEVTWAPSRPARTRYTSPSLPRVPSRRKTLPLTSGIYMLSIYLPIYIYLCIYILKENVYVYIWIATTFVLSFEVDRGCIILGFNYE